MSTEDDLWNRILARIAGGISQGCFDTWFRPVASACREGNTLQLSVPSEAFRQSLIDNYGDVLHEAVAEVVGSDIKVEVTASAGAADQSRATGNGTIVPLPVVQASALEVPAVRHTWLVDQLWTDRAVGVIGGGPKLGKSWLALDIAVSIASGTPCPGTFKVHTSGPVLLYAAEDSAAALRGRLETLTCIRQLDFESLDVRVITAASLRLDRIEDQDRLEATVALHRPVMLILDPLVRVHAIDENVAGQVAALLAYLRALQRKHGVAIGLVHHVRKNVSSATGAGYSLRGSGDLYAWLDSFLYIRKNHDQLTLSSEHRSAPGAGPFILELVKPDADRGTHLKILAAGSINPNPNPEAERVNENETPPTRI